MKFSKIILAFAASFLILFQAGAATIVGNLMDIYGGGIDRTIKISPKSTPQAVTYNGTNYTVMDLAKTVSSTNSIFAVVLLGGIYNVDFGTVNGVATPVTKILVPPYDANTYSFNYVANLATNLGTFVWTNSYGIAAGTNIVITTNGALLVINASAPAAAVPTNFASIIVTNSATIISTSSADGFIVGSNVMIGGNKFYYYGNGNRFASSSGSLYWGGLANAVFAGSGGGLFSTNGTQIFDSLTTNFTAASFVASGTIRGSQTIVSNSDIQGTLFNSTGTLNIIQSDGDGLGISVRSGNGDNVGPNSPGGAVSIATGTSYGAQNSAADLSIQAGNGSGDSSGPAVYGRGSDVNIAAGTGSGGYRDGKINLNGTVTVLGSISGNGSGLTNLVTPTNFASITATNSATMLSNVLIANNLYVTNHAYDVSTSQLDPEANEYVTASFVRSVLNNGAFLYGTTNTIAVGFSNILTSSTNKISLQFGANAPSGYTKGFTNFVTGTYPNGPYFASIVSTNTYQAVTGPFVNDFYIQADGSGGGHALGIAPDIFVTYDLTNLIPICAGSEQSLTMAATTNLYTWIQSAAQYNSTNTAGFYVVRRVRVTSQNGTALYINVKGGSGTATTLAFNTPVTVNANYIGTFTGNGSGLTNIPATGITGLGTAAYSNSTAFAPSTVTNLTAAQLATIAAAVTNNASPTLTGLSVGAQTALDVNGNGKVGGVGLTNGVLTGNGSGLTNIKSSAVVATNIITWFGVEQFANVWESRYNQALGNNLPFISSGITGFVYPISGIYIGPYFRTTPQMTAPYTNFNVTLYLIATNNTTAFSNPNHSFDYRLQDVNSTNCVNSSSSFTIGTLTNGMNIKTSKISFPPNFTNSFCQFSVNNGSSYFTNTVWCIGIKLEAY